MQSFREFLEGKNGTTTGNIERKVTKSDFTGKHGGDDDHGDTGLTGDRTSSVRGKRARGSVEGDGKKGSKGEGNGEPIKDYGRKRNNTN